MLDNRTKEKRGEGSDHHTIVMLSGVEASLTILFSDASRAGKESEILRLRFASAKLRSE
jgi:hypothetical protein